MKKKFLVILFCCLLNINFVYALSNTLLLDNAQKYFNNGQYEQALNSINELLKSPSNDDFYVKALLLKSKIYIRTGQNSLSLETNKKINSVCNKHNKDGIFYNINQEAHLLSFDILAAAMNKEYINTKRYNDSVITNMLEEMEELETTQLVKYLSLLLKSDKYSNLVKIRIVKVALPKIVYYNSNADNSKYKLGGKPSHNENFFAIYATVLKAIMLTNEAEFIEDGTTKASVLKSIKMNQDVFSTDYDKDFAEAVYLYYTGNEKEAKRLLRTIQKHYEYKEQKVVYSPASNYYGRNTEVRNTNYTEEMFRYIDNYVCKCLSNNQLKTTNTEIKNFVKGSGNFLIQTVEQILGQSIPISF